VSTFCFDFRLGLVRIPLHEPQSGIRFLFLLLELCFCGLFLFPFEFHEPAFRFLPQDFLLALGNFFPLVISDSRSDSALGVGRLPEAAKSGLYLIGCPRFLVTWLETQTFAREIRCYLKPRLDTRRA
jgi:hypothetical protein